MDVIPTANAYLLYTTYEGRRLMILQLIQRKEKVIIVGYLNITIVWL